ncbi:MAG: binding--dependent transport system inner rane component family protein [Acidimicrobiales bacterium]|nr:binding--dependent transport system inner rane component family protein [Acidimicrobiales bacterium]
MGSLRPTAGRRASAWLHRRPRVRLGLLLGLPLAWMVVIYLGALIALLVQSFFSLDDFTGQVNRRLTLSTWHQLLTRVTFDTVMRTMLMALAVTLASVVVAFPIAYFMARLATPRVKAILYVLMLLPLWASYMVKVYSWNLILAKGGVVEWAVHHLGLTSVLDWLLRLPVVGGGYLGASLLGQFLVFVYMWLPYMILPVEVALERVPASLVDASGDLGAQPRTTFRRVVWPLAKPGIVAGSIFTFSLTLGDFIIPTLIGTSQPSIGKAIYEYQGTSGNLPLAAAFAVIPVLIMAIYLTAAKRMGAFEAL